MTENESFGKESAFNKADAERSNEKQSFPELKLGEAAQRETVCEVCGHINKGRSLICEMCSNYLID